MKALIRCFWLLLCFGFISSVWAQSQEGMTGPGRHLTPRHRMASLMSKAKRSAQPGSYLAPAITSDKSKTWDLGVYPGGTWAELHGINDFGIAVGVGDVAGDQRMIGVPLFGTNAGNWFESYVSSGAVDELLPTISNTGMIAGAITGDNGNPEAYAWMPNHAGFHLGTLPGDFASYAYAINHPGTFIVGQSFRELQEAPFIIGTAVVWTPRVNWTVGRPTLAWEIHALPTGGLDQPGAVFEGVTLRFWGGWGVNDFGQIAGEGYQYDPVLDEWWEIGVVWNPVKGGKEWEIQQLPLADGHPYTEPLSIDNLGEIVGDVWGWTDTFQGAFPALWKKDPKKNSWSVNVLPTTSALDFGWSIAWDINESGDIVGSCTDENWIGKATRWNTHDLSFVTSLGFPGDTSNATGVNNLGIAVGGYQNFVLDENGNPQFDEYGNYIFGPGQAVAVRFR